MPSYTRQGKEEPSPGRGTNELSEQNLVSGDQSGETNNSRYQEDLITWRTEDNRSS